MLALMAGRSLPYYPVFGRRPGTLGWLLAGAPERAAGEMYDAHHNPASHNQYYPVEWLESVMHDVWTTLQSLDTYRSFCDANERFFDALCAAEQHLAEGLLIIRDRYEGGLPIV